MLRFRFSEFGSSDSTPAFHQRVGVRYYVLNDVFVGITLRSYAFHISDFVEWTAGYRW